MPATATVRPRNAAAGPQDEAALRDQLRRLAARVVALEAAVRVLRGDADQVDRVTRWLAVIARASTGHVFSAAELRAHGRLDPDLAAALAPFPTNKQLGKRLRAIAGRPYGAFRLERIDRDAHGTLWIVQVSA